MTFTYHLQPNELIELFDSVQSKTAARRRALGFSLAIAFALVLVTYMYVEFSQRAAGKFPAKPGSGYVRHVWLEAAVVAVVVLNVIGRIRWYFVGVRLQRLANEMLATSQTVELADDRTVRLASGSHHSFQWSEFSAIYETPSVVALIPRSNRISDAIGIPKRVMSEDELVAMVGFIHRRLRPVAARLD